MGNHWMKLSGKPILWWSAGLFLFCLLALLASVFVLPRQYASQQTVEVSFTIDQDFTTVRNILVRTDALKRIVTMTGESKFLDQNWSTLGGGLESIDPLNIRWKLELQGTLKVRTLGEYVGRNEVTLRQEIKIDPDQLVSDVKLTEGSKRLLDYQMTTSFMRDEAGNKTRVVQRLKQEILTDTPWFAHWIADRRVRASTQLALTNQQRAIRKVIEDNLDKRWLLPLTLKGAFGSRPR
jgi:hypothetical protein